MPIHDFIGIGLGPFNLGLACLSDPVEDLDGIFLEARHELSWHPGMMLDDATLQVPFLADLVTLADPTSRWSFLAYLKETGNLYPFYIQESFYPLRREYDDYCRWAADGLDSVRLGQRVVHVEQATGRDGTIYIVTTGTGEQYRGRRLVLGVGTSPHVPRPLTGMGLHSSDYLRHKPDLQRRSSITIVGSGQSAAEIYRDLLAESPRYDYELHWITRSPRFLPMEYAKLTLELTSPEYTSYFHGLPERTRARLLREQRSLYKGISSHLVDDIFGLHYRLRANGDGPRTTMVSNTAVVGAERRGEGYWLDLHHEETDERFALETEGLVVATGYEARVPDFLDPIRERIAWDEQGRFRVSSEYAVDRSPGRPEIFVQNAGDHTHGLSSPDLGMGAHRNSVIIAAMTGREVYPIEKRVAVQTFGVPNHLRSVR